MRDIFAGATIVVFSLFFLIPGLNYGVGTFSRMDTGSFPVALSAVMIVMGIIIGIGGFLNRKDHAISLDLSRSRPMIFVAVAIISFSISIERIGLIPATVAVVFISSIADKNNKLLTSILLSSFISLLIWLIFKLGLGLPIASFKGLG